MANITKTALVPYAPAQMFDLVNAIEEYPVFLKNCVKTVVHSRNNEEIRATLVLCKGALQQKFTTLNRLQPYKMIEMKLLEGPFKYLQGYWRFEPLGEQGEEGCRVSFDLEFEFSNKLIGFAFGGTLQSMASTMVDAFCQRAKSLYG